MRRALVPLLLLLVGCAARAFPPALVAAAPPARPDPSAPLPPFDVQNAAIALARWRGIELRSPIQVEELEPDAFLARRRSEPTDGRRAQRGADVGGFWSAYGFAAPATDLDAVANKITDERLLGFYSSRAKKLFVRKKVGGLVGNQRVLLHEIEHALQDQNFGMADLAAAPDDDIELAKKSLYEGDAELASFGFDHDPTKPPSRAGLVRVARKIRATPLDELIKGGDDISKDVLAAPPLMRARRASPYLDGLAFAADIYRAGGFELLAKVFAHPPVSTEQVLHPEKYVAGEMPIPVDAPKAPIGHRVVTTGRMGELQLGVFLAQCADAITAKQLATGWGGDAYAVVARSDEATGVLLATAWDDEASATRFASALESRRACLSKLGGRDAAIAETLAVRRDKTRVAYVHGVDAALRDQALRDLLSLPGAPPPRAPPIGDVTLPISAVPEDFVAHGRIDDANRFESAPLGISCKVPEKPRAAGGAEELFFQSGTYPTVAGSMRFAFTPPADVDLEFERDLVAGVTRTFPHEKLNDEGVRDVTYSFGPARTHRWSFANGVAVMSIVAPMCGGNGSLIFRTWFSDANALAVIELWLESIEVRAKDAPVCAYLADSRR